MPTLTAINTTIKISARAAAQLERGGLWIFSNEIQGKITGLQPGTPCWFESTHGIVGTGYINPHSLIAGRILSWKKEESMEALLRLRLSAAFLRRRNLQARDSFRLVFSEADFIPGLIVDCYSGVVVVQSNTAGIDQMIETIEQLIPELYKEVFNEELQGFVVRGDTSIRRLEGIEDFRRVLIGDEASLRRAFFKEDDLYYQADLLEGQKTGFFLDQRDNRSALERIVDVREDTRMLDLFCYSGGWGLRALRGGASRVTFVDQSAEAIELVKAGVAKNQFDEKSAEYVVSDAFEYLESCKEEFEVIVVDPPAFVKSKKVLPQAMKAYEKLNRLAWRRLPPGGILFSSSCSYHLGESEFLEILRAAVSKEGGRAHIIYRGDQSTDHPVLLSMPETRYLKCIGLQKL